MQGFTTRKTNVAGIGGSHSWIGSASTEQGLGKALGQQALTDALWTNEQVSMSYLLSCERTAQDIYRMLVTDNIPVLRLYLMHCHAIMVAETRCDSKAQPNT